MSHFGVTPGRPCLFLPRWLESLLREKVTIQDLPEDVLLDILSMVPKKDLIFHCRLVCSRWRDLVDLPILWKRKAERCGLYPKTSHGPIQDWRTFYFDHCLRNLVKNPCGEEGLAFWDLTETDWATYPLEGYFSSMWMSHAPKDVQKCFVLAGPYLLNKTKSQRINLREEGYSDQLMDERRPPIVVKDWLYKYWFGHCELRVKLLSADYEVLQECQLDLKLDWWCQVSHTFEDYPPGVRHIDVEHTVSVTKTEVLITNTSITVDHEASPRRNEPITGITHLKLFFKRLRNWGTWNTGSV